MKGTGSKSGELKLVLHLFPNHLSVSIMYKFIF